MKIALKITLFFLLFIGLRASYAQNDPQLTQFMFSPLLFNPAFAGTQDAIVTSVNARNQWVDIPGAPTTQTLTTHLPLFKLSSGIGLSVINAQLGQQRTTSGTISYAYHKSIRKSMLSFGGYGGVVQRSLDGSRLIAPQGSYNDGTVDHNDAYIPISLESDILFDAGVGLFLQSNRFFAGVSLTHLLNNSFNFVTETASTQIQYNQNGYVFAGYKFLLGEQFQLTPNLLFKTDLVQNMVDINTNLTYNNTIMFGVSFRSFLNEQTDAVALLAGWNISEKFAINYSYDLTLSELNTVSNGSHEIGLIYKIKVEKPRAGKEINNFRYLYY